MGVSYRAAVGDTRDSPSAVFVQAARARGADVVCHDPLVAFWDELDIPILSAVPAATGIDAVVFAVSHASYSELDFTEWFNGDRPVVLDANDVLSSDQRAVLRRMGCKVAAIGRGTL